MATIRKSKRTNSWRYEVLLTGYAGMPWFEDMAQRRRIHGRGKAAFDAALERDMAKNVGALLHVIRQLAWNDRNSEWALSFDRQALTLAGEPFELSDVVASLAQALEML